MPHSSHPDSPARRERRRRTHQRIDSSGDAAPRSRRPRDDEERELERRRERSRRRARERSDDAPTSPSKQRPKNQHHRGARDRSHARRSSRPERGKHSRSASTGLSSAQLAQLDSMNEKIGWNEHDGMARRERIQDDTRGAEYDADRVREREEREERRRREDQERKRQKRKEERAAAEAALAREANSEVDSEEDEDEDLAPKYSRYRERRGSGRIVSGQALERGSRKRVGEKDGYRHDARRRNVSSDGEYDEEARRRKRRKWCIVAGLTGLILMIVVPVGVVMTNKNSSSTSSSGGDVGTVRPENSNLNSIEESSVPAAAKGTILDPFDWYDTTDFNVTFTDVKVGGLPVMGLNSTWDDTTRANDKVPPLNEEWDYGTRRYRGVNIGGWLNIEPFITPSFFDQFSTSDGVVDEWTLSEKLGLTQTRTQLEQHYSSWVNEQTFAEIQAAGFDHVRIPYGYWMVTTYDGDPYLPQVSWRYLLRAIEWARQHGLRIKLDLHGAPGSQNGWNHSGHQGEIGWLQGTDGALNGQRTIDIHKQLTAFFTQERYKNVVTMIGLVNEPKMTTLDSSTVMTWTRNCIATIREGGFKGPLVIGDGFMGLDKWQGQLQGLDNVVLDVHQYVIFNVQQLILNHHDKATFACDGWSSQAERSMDTTTGFGPTMFGEWSQADTDCAPYLNNVGVGSRWEGTLNMINTPGGSTSGSVLEPTCPTGNSPRCSCTEANADASSYSDAYKFWLRTFAEAQMDSFELGWGWFYWTWATEKASQWSYRDGLAAGMLPQNVHERDWSCNSSVPDFAKQGLPEYY